MIDILKKYKYENIYGIIQYVSSSSKNTKIYLIGRNGCIRVCKSYY